MARAMLNGAVITESDHPEVVEGSHYFPHSSVNGDYLCESHARDSALTCNSYAVEFPFLLSSKDVALELV